jgi:hypothetical protein
MTKSTKAALLSGLIFPGIGHIGLKQYLRGSILALVSLLAMSAMVKVAFQRPRSRWRQLWESRRLRGSALRASAEPPTRGFSERR